MLYAIIAEDLPALGPQAREAPRPPGAVEGAARGGTLVLAGPHPAIDAQDPGGGLHGLARRGRVRDARGRDRLAAEDPYALGGVYARVTVKPFRKVCGMKAGTEQVIRERLAALQPVTLDLRDESEQHAGHAGAASGGGHWQLTIVSEAFRGKNAVARHRMVYEALATS